MPEPDRISTLEKNEAVTGVRIDHIFERLDEIKVKQGAMDVKLDNIHQTVIAASAVGKASLYVGSGIGRFLPGILTAVLGGAAALFGHSFIR